MPVLAAVVDTNSAAYRAGQDSASLALYGLLLFILVSVVMAIARRTRGWIVAASVSVFLFLMIIGTSFAILAYAAKKKAALQARSETSGPQTAAVTPLARPLPQLITGTEPGYAIEYPAGWLVQRKLKAFDSIANQKTMGVGVIAGKELMGSPERVSEMVRVQLKKTTPSSSCGEASPFSLDGRRWLQFSATNTVQGIPTAMVMYVYSGQEGTFQIIGMIPQSLYASDAGEMVKVMQSFRFSR